MSPYTTLFRSGRLHGVNHDDAIFGIMTQHRLGFHFVNVEPLLDDLFIGVIEAIVFQRALFQPAEQRFAVWAGEMKNFFHVDELPHDLGLIHIPRNAVEHEDVDVRFEFVRVHRGIDRFFPKFDSNVVWNELAFARVFQKRFPDFCARIDRTKHLAARTMIKALNGTERFALGPFPAAGRTKQDERAVFHESEWLYCSRSQSGEERLFRSDRIDIDSSSAAIEADVAVDQSENRVIAAEANVLTRQKFRAALANNDVASHDQLAAESFYTEPLANAVAAVLNAALSFFMSHDLRFFRF